MRAQVLISYRQEASHGYSLISVLLWSLWAGMILVGMTWHQCASCEVGEIVLLWLVNSFLSSQGALPLLAILQRYPSTYFSTSGYNKNPSGRTGVPGPHCSVTSNIPFILSSCHPATPEHPHFLARVLRHSPGRTGIYYVIQAGLKRVRNLLARG